MKQILTSIAVLLLCAGLSAQDQSKVETLKTFLDETFTFDVSEINRHEPLITIRELAAAKADKAVELNKENIESGINQMKDYSKAIIIVGKHTIAMISDIEDCQQSGAWGACMPKATGYVQKQGQLIAHDNYLNYIIGVPDSQERTLYLFK